MDSRVRAWVWLACLVVAAVLALTTHSRPEHLTPGGSADSSTRWEPLLDAGGKVLLTPNASAANLHQQFQNATLLPLMLWKGYHEYMKQNIGTFKTKCNVTAVLKTTPLTKPVVGFTRYYAPRNVHQWELVADYVYPCYGDAILKNGKSVGYVNQTQTQTVRLRIRVERVRDAKSKPYTFSIQSIPVPVSSSPASQRGPYTGGLVTAMSATDLFEAPGGGAWRIQGVDKASAALVKDGQDTVVQVRYPRDSGSGSTPKGSSIAGGMRNGDAVPAGLPASAIVLAFDVCFRKGFNFAEGGKLLGLGVGVGAASGKDHSPTAASHRINFQKDGSAVSYIYIPQGLSQSNTKLTDDGGGNKFFEDIFPAGTLKVGDGQYNHIELGIKINSFDTTKSPSAVADGIAVLTINGVSGEVKDVRWSASPDLLINYVTFNTFFGGKTPSQVDSVAHFKNFALHAWKK